MIRLALLFALVAASIGLFWYGMGRPIAVPPSPLDQGQKLNCLSYAPFHGSQAPFDQPLRLPDAQIESDLQKLSEVTSCIRTYSAARAQGKITRIAGKHGLKVLQGIWIGRNLADNRREIEGAMRLARRHPGVIEAFIVGNETLLRGELGADRIKTYLEEVKRRSGLPVTYADVWEFWLKAPELAEAADFITIHILPYWEDEPVAATEAVAHVGDVRDKVAKIFAGKDILIGEVGWPSEGRMRDGALPSPANQALVLSGVVEAAKAGNWKVNLIEAFDQPWKRLLEGTVGGYWGMFDDGARKLKFRWASPCRTTRGGGSRLRSASAPPFSSSPPPGSRGARTTRARIAGDAISPSLRSRLAPGSSSAGRFSDCRWSRRNLATACARPG